MSCSQRETRSWRAPLPKDYGPVGEGLRVTDYGVTPEALAPAARRFLRSVGAPEGEDFAEVAQGAQAAEVLLDAIARSDGTRAGVVEELFDTRVTGGILGSFSFDRYGDITPATSRPVLDPQWRARRRRRRPCSKSPRQVIASSVAGRAAGSRAVARGTGTREGRGRPDLPSLRGGGVRVECSLFGDSLATSSKIVAAVFTLLAGSLAIVKQVAATMESHASGLEEAAPIEAVSIGGVLSKLISG